MVEKSNPTLVGTITNKGEKTQIGEIRIYDTIGWIRINTKEAKIDEFGYLYAWVQTQ